MRWTVIAWVTLVCIGGAARADSATHLRVGVAGQLGSRDCEHCGGANRSGGPTLRALWDVSARVRFGAMFEHLWYGGSDVELDVTQQVVYALLELRLSPWAALDVGLGAGRYTGRVDIPETVTIELSLHGVSAFALARSEDIHEFLPPDLALRADLGVAFAF